MFGIVVCERPNLRYLHWSTYIMTLSIIVAGCGRLPLAEGGWRWRLDRDDDRSGRYYDVDAHSRETDNSLSKLAVLLGLACGSGDNSRGFSGSERGGLATLENNSSDRCNTDSVDANKTTCILSKSTVSTLASTTSSIS